MKIENSFTKHYVGNWEGYEVYKQVSLTKTYRIGFPQFILKSGEQERIATPEENLQIFEMLTAA